MSAAIDASHDGMGQPAVFAFDVDAEKSDTVGGELSYVTRALYVGVTGNVKVITSQGSTVTFVAVPAGAILPIRVKQVYITGTTAGSILGMY